MTVETSTSKVQYLGDGVAFEFPVPFPVLEESHIRLYTWADNKQAEITIDFQVLGVGSSNVRVVLGAPLATGIKLTILRALPLVQSMDLENGGPFNADTLEGSADNLEMQIQQINEALGRSILFPESYDGLTINWEELLEMEKRCIESADNAQESEDAAAQSEELSKAWAGLAEDRANQILTLKVAYEPKPPENPNNPQGSVEYDPEDNLLTLVVPLGGQGIQGVQGEQGREGLKGDRGHVGPKGPIGERGIQGTPGPEGDQGPQGNMGDSPWSQAFGHFRLEPEGLLMDYLGTQETNQFSINNNGELEVTIHANN